MNVGDNGAEISFVGNLQRLELKPGDKLVLTVDECLSQSQRLHIMAEVQRFIGTDVECGVLLLDRGFKLGVINFDAAKAPEKAA